MAFGKDIFCHGIEPYNFRDTDETVSTITANVGQSTAIGPKVAIRRKIPFPTNSECVSVDMGGEKSYLNISCNLSPTITCTHGGEPIIGKIDASIYKKNSFQDNTKYINERKTRKDKMGKTNPTEVLKQAIGNGKDVLGVINLSEALLRIVSEGVMTMNEAIESLGDIRKSLGEKAEETKTNVETAVERAKSMGKEYESMKEAIKDINADAPHQQDQLNCQDDAARTLAASTHGAASHLTKTVCEGENEEGVEMCIVRRLTPTETARLQGFPDDYTKIDGKETSDAPQFKSHGNSWATPCANFISVRVEMELRRLGHAGTINYATCCSGIEAHSVAVKGLDWKSVFFSEIEPFPCRVLAAHYQNTPNLGDMTQIHYDSEKGVITNEHAKGEEYSLPSCFKEATIQEIPFKEGDLQVFSGGTPCFTAGHKILMGDGTEKNIEDVLVGDIVVTHLGNKSKVLKTGTKVVETTTTMVMDDEENTSFVVTENHPFWGYVEGLTNIGWIPVSHIRVLHNEHRKNVWLARIDKDCIESGWNFQSVYTISKVNRRIAVYNLEVEGDHSYICNGYCVHNCQSISVAGKREGMAEGSGTRSSLAFHYQRIIDEIKPTFTIWENVPGAFSSNGGADFIWFVNKCAESGYAMAWRVLDAQYTMTEEFPRAVPQRRRRIWLVGYKGNDWRVPARVVFELEKYLTANPPMRVPGLGFKTLNEDAKIEIDKAGQTEALPKADSDNLIGLVMESDDGRKDLLKVARMIEFSEMPEESDFSNVPMASIYEFAKKVGEPMYIGSVFCTNKRKKNVKVDESTMDLFSMFEPVNPDSEAEKKVEEDNESEELVGVEKINPAILENIGNSGILANGRICTLNCHEWTSGIQLSPSTYNAWLLLLKHKDWIRANNLLPEAYDETVCGLSDVLQEDPDRKYNLSWRACFGILKRAETRGKELPPALAIALVSTIRENAGIVKWIALNGKETKKKETDLSERESAMLCFEKFVASVAEFDEVEAVQPKRNSDSEEDENEDIDIDQSDVDEDGNLEEKEYNAKTSKSVINVGGGETAATLIASGDAAVGTTQDANVIAVKK